MSSEQPPLPKIGETMNAERAYALCSYYGFTNLAKRIAAHPDHYHDWVFDGASMLPDALFAMVFHIPNLVEIALKHDLKYAYGEPGNSEEKHHADLAFEAELLADGADKAVAKLMYSAVHVLGGEWLKADFSWAFAHKKESK